MTPSCKIIYVGQSDSTEGVAPSCEFAALVGRARRDSLGCGPGCCVIVEQCGGGMSIIATEGRIRRYTLEAAE